MIILWSKQRTSGWHRRSGESARLTAADQSGPKKAIGFVTRFVMDLQSHLPKIWNCCFGAAGNKSVSGWTRVVRLCTDLQSFTVIMPAIERGKNLTKLKASNSDYG